MSLRRLSFYFLPVLLAAVLIGLPIKSQYSGPQNQAATQQETVLTSGRNVNMVSGTTLPGGDPWLQRQNEPSVAVSSRNPLHLIAGANDYRTVDMAISEGELPGKAQGAMAGDAWVGIYKSFDGGESWITSLIPGFPQDNSAVGTASPLKQFSTAADPIVRAGTNGLFYFSGMAFNRNQTKGGGSVFVTRFIDNNNVEGTDPIKYLDTKIIDQGTSGQFIDMPRIAVDIPRGSGTITIDGQSIPRSNIYSAYTVFLGNLEQNIRSKILFRRSTDCGATWSSAIKISESQHIIQGATIAIDPTSGAVYVAYRRFQHPSQTNSIVIVKSTDFGQTFSTPTVIANINPFDQPVTDSAGDDISDPLGTSFRTNSYPTVAVDNTGIVYVAWAERGKGPGGAARIVMATSQGGSGWTSPALFESSQEPSHLGHQFMPYLSFVAGKLTMAWYDQRNSVGANIYGFNNWISDGMQVRQTVDIRAAQASPGMLPTFEPSIQVSRYYFTLKKISDTAYTVEQAQFNPPNYPLFKGGTVPFHGDYVEMTPSPLFVLGANGWSFNTTPSTSPAPPVFHVVWTDNRDVRPPDAANNYDWTNYTPPASNQGSYGNKTSCAPLTVGMRNQNIYTSRLSNEIVAAAPGNAKSLGDDLGYYNNDPNEGLIRRAFAIYVKNTTGIIKNMHLEIIAWPATGGASFLEFSTLHNLDVQIAPYSTIARTIFVWSTTDYDTAKVEIFEGNTSWGVIVLNPDPTNPAPGNSLGFEEIHDPVILSPNIVNWPNPNIVNPNIVNPNIVNPNIVNFANPNIVNPNIVNPNIVNPNIVNPNIVNPNSVNPNIVNPNIVNPNIVNTPEEVATAAVKDVVCTVRNEGNTVSAYTLKTFSKEAFPAGLYLQLLVYKSHSTPSGGVDISDDNCSLKTERHHELLLNVSNPNIVNPNIVNPNIVNPNIVNAPIENATFSLAPGEEATVNLRVMEVDPKTLKMLANNKVFSLQTFVDSLGFAVTAHAVNTDDAKDGNYSPPAAASKLVIGTASLPDGVAQKTYSATLIAYGGTEPYFWYLNSGELPPGLSLGTGGVISGTPTAAGFYHFIVRVDDSSIPQQFDTQQYSIYIDTDQIPDALTITTISPLPSGVQGYWYGTTLETTGGVWPRMWSLNPGSNPLPSGLSLDSGGVISGTPTVSGSFSFTVRVTDKSNNSAAKPFVLTINTQTTTYYTISGTVYDEYGNPLSGVVLHGLPNTPITASNGTYQDSVPAGWSGTATPFKVGHSFSPPSRTYSNQSASQSGQDYNIEFILLTISGTINNGVSGLADVVMNGLPGNPETDGSGFYSGQVPYGWTGTVTPHLDNHHIIPSHTDYEKITSNQTTNYSWELAKYQLNVSKAGTGAGTVTSADGGINCGAVCQKNYDYGTNVVLTATPAIASIFAGWTGDVHSGHGSDNPLTVTVDGNKSLSATFDSAPPLVITTVAVPDGVKNTGYETTLQFAGGIPPVNWSVLSGSLPPGLILKSGTGQIIGIPTVTGYFNFTIQAQDASLQTVTRAFSMTVAEWVVRYNGPGNSTDTGKKITVDSSGNIYVTGSSIGSGTGSDYATVKYNSSGVQQWIATYNGLGNGNDSANAIAVDSWGNVYVTGSSIGSGTTLPDYATIKYNSSGVEQWVARYDGPPGNIEDGAFAIAVDASGNVYVTGYSGSVPQKYDFATIKYNSSGVQQWVALYNGPANDADIASALAVDAAGNVYVTGSAFGTAIETDYATIKYNSSGVQQWVARYDGPAHDYDYGSAIAVDAAGNVYVTGASIGSGTNRNYATIKYNNLGTQEWVATYDGPGNGEDYGRAIAVDSAGNIYVTGASIGSGTNRDYATIKYNNLGAQEWVARYNGAVDGEDWANAIAITPLPLGDVYVIGYSIGSPTARDYAIVRYSNAGAQQWVARYNGPGNGDDSGQAIAIDSLGNVYATGESTGSGTAKDYATIRYTQSFPSTLIISTETLDIGYVGTPYATTIWAFGGSGSRTWSIINGALPPGLDLSGGSGRIAGTPNTAGTYSFEVQVVDGSLTATKTLSIAISIIVGPPAKLAFSQQPSNATGGATIAPPVTVEIQDAAGNLVTTATDTVVLSLRNADGAILSGTLSRPAVGGVATFNDLSVDKVGTGYQLRANSGSLTEVDSSPFTITGGAASKIQVETMADGSGTIVPAQDLAAGSWISVFAIERDAGGNFIGNVAPDSWSLINKTGGVVDGDLVPAGVQKVAALTGHALGSAQIHVAKSGLTSIDSGTITITGGAAGLFETMWGSPGAGDTQFNQPFGVGVDKNSGSVYIADTVNDRIQKFSSGGTFQLKWGGNGSGDGQFDNPIGVAVDGAGNVYVAEGSSVPTNRRVQKFNSSGVYQTKFSFSGLITLASGIALDSSGTNVYVLENHNGRVEHWTTTNGIDYTHVGGWGVPGYGPDPYYMVNPYGIAVDSAGNVYVADRGNYRILKYTSNGSFITTWGSQGSGDNQFGDPRGIAVDNSGYVYVVDRLYFRIQKFTSDGTFLSKWGGTQGSGNGQFDYPQGIAVNGSSNVYVTEISPNQRVQKFR